VQGIVFQLNLSKGGIPKLPVLQAFARRLGLEGDAVNHPDIHGGPGKAVLLVSQEDLDSLAAKGFSVYPGALGENLTVEGLDFRLLRPGMRFRSGAAVLELTRLRRPCSALDLFNTPAAPGPIQDAVWDEACQAGDPASPRWALAGFYAAVASEGLIRAGDKIELLDAAV
jgi:MOSC domain-containing protein YiiM